LTEPEQLTQHQSKRLIEGFVSKYAQHGREFVGCGLLQVSLVPCV
jgi:hypothetical protein